MLSMLALWGCSGSSVPPKPTVDPSLKEDRLPSGRKKGKTYRMEFEDLALEPAMLKATEPTATKSVLVGFDSYPIDFHRIYRRGDSGFGDRVDASKQPIEEACNNQDYNALFEAKDAIWLVSHFECTPGEIFLTRMAADDAGLLTPEFTRAADFSAHGGLWNPCAGMITPWGSHLGSEEYEPNAAKVPVSLEEDGWDYRSWSQMQELYLGGGELEPYRYGWTPEVGIMTVDGDTITAKHKSLGRFSHEIAYVMPDQRTVYMSDDGTGGGLFMFVADKPGVLAAGKLYAARYDQKSAEMGGTGQVTWVPMGAAEDKYIDALIANGVRFDQLFDKAEPKEGACPENFVRIRADGREECLKLQEGSEAVPNVAVAASRLETRRYAAYLGATTEFEKGEGIALDPENKFLYVAFAKIGGRMAVENDGFHSDHIQLPENPCGAIWTGPLTGERNDLLGKPIDSEWVLTGMRSLVAGKAIEKDEQGNTCAPGGIANPDNIAFLPFYRTLMIAEDTSRHPLASLWALDTERALLRRTMVAPPHAEITGITWSTNLEGHGYLSVAIQHPWRAETLGETELPEGITAEHQKSITGYLGPFPPLD